MLLKGLIIFFVLIILIGIIIFAGIKKIPLGHKAIKSTLGNQKTIVNEGYTWNIPFVEKIEIIDCRERLIRGIELRITFKNSSPTTLYIDCSFKISDIFIYRDKYRNNDFTSEIKHYMSKGLTEYFTEQKFQEYKKNIFDTENSLKQINSKHISKLGISLTRISINSISIDKT